MRDLSILIVEDEPLERDMLMAQVRETFDCFALIQAVDNGIEALHMCQVQQPDIVLVDINIPGISGLSLIETLRGFAFPGEIIITTAYDRFDYAKRAISLGVGEYLLKPIDEEELSRSVHKALDTLTRAREAGREALGSGMAPVWSYAQAYLVRDLLHGNIPQNALQSLFDWPAEGRLQARCLCYAAQTPDENAQALFYRTCGSLFDADFVTLRAQIGDEMILLLHPKMPMEEGYLHALIYIRALALASAVQSGGPASLYVGDMAATYQSLRDGYYRQSTLPRVRALGNTCLFMRPMDPQPLCAARERRKLQQKWLQRLREGQVSYILPMLKRAMSREGAYWPGAVLLLEALRLLDPSADLEAALDILRRPNAFEPLGEWLSAFLASQGHERSPGTGNHQRTVAQMALRAMRERYGEDLAQSALAEEFGLSQAHFSRLFKKEIGMSFVSMLTSIRMDEARRMLATGAAVREVACKCGYANVKYFVIAFKKEVGCTPAQYQQPAASASGEAETP